MDKKFPILDPKSAVYKFKNGINFGRINLNHNTESANLSQTIWINIKSPNPYGININDGLESLTG